MYSVQLRIRELRISSERSLRQNPMHSRKGEEIIECRILVDFTYDGRKHVVASYTIAKCLWGHKLPQHRTFSYMKVLEHEFRTVYPSELSFQTRPRLGRHMFPAEIMHATLLQISLLRTFQDSRETIKKPI